MRLVKLFGKLLLLPVLVFLGIFRLLMKIGIKVSSLILGAAMLIVFGCIMITLIQRTWNSMWILVFAEVILVLITMVTGAAQGILEIANDRLREFLKS